MKQDMKCSLIKRFTENLRRIYDVNVLEVWLKDDVKGKAYISGVDGSFHLADIMEQTTLTVKGPDLLQSISLPHRANLFQLSSLYSASPSTVSSTPSGSSPGSVYILAILNPKN